MDSVSRKTDVTTALFEAFDYQDQVAVRKLVSLLWTSLNTTAWKVPKPGNSSTVPLGMNTSTVSGLR